jgi:adenylate cyclase
MADLALRLVADVVGYSWLAGADEDRILARLRALRSDLIDPTHRPRCTDMTAQRRFETFNSLATNVACGADLTCSMLFSGTVGPGATYAFSLRPLSGALRPHRS